MMAITVTMTIYLFVLLPASFQQPGVHQPFSLTDTLVHVLTPCLLIVDWLVFVPKRKFRAIDPLLWTLIPYTYLLFVLIYSSAGGEFGSGRKVPYHFLNVAELGVGGVATWIIGLTIALVILGYLYFGLDRLLGRLGRTR